MLNFNDREKRIFAITLATWGVFLVGSGLIMNAQVKPVVNTTYHLKVEKKKIAEAQAKTNEIKLKDITLEINTPLSVDIKDYLDEIEKISKETLKELKLDTSLVNINQAGKYQYFINYKKKKYVGTIIIKEKELPKITLKDFSYELGKVTLSAYAKDYITEELTPEVYNSCSNPDLSQVKADIVGEYEYSITCNKITYKGKIKIESPKQNQIITTPANSIECKDNAQIENNQCICPDNSKEYDKTQEKCVEKKIETEKNEQQ